MAGFTLGNTEIKHGLVLAPMAGVTDRAFRILAKRQGAELMVSEMISAKAIKYKDKKTASLADFSEEEEPMSIQIFGNEPETMAYAASELCERFPALTAIDINMGCPMPKITGNGEGCALMRTPELAGRVVRAVSEAIQKPVTVKMRTGWDSGVLNAPFLASVCEENGAALICVHGRTGKQLYAPPIDRETIRLVKQAVTVPVVANGGVYSAEDAASLLEETGCDGVAIGQGAMGNPWIFRSITEYLDGGGQYTPSLEEKRNTALLHLELLVKYKGEYIGTREARRHIAYYLRGIKGAALCRDRLNHAESSEELYAVTEEFFATALKGERG